MKKEEIHINDVHRILFGDSPPEILLEVMMRSIILYLALVIVVRLLGKRTNSILTITERAVFITLGAIVAMPMHGPKHGIIIGVVVLLTVLILQRGFTRSFFISRRWEEKLQGTVTILVKDAVIEVEKLKQHSLSRQQLFQLLREKDIRHLGQVKRAYIEASGTMSVYKFDKIKPGLSILPVADIDDIIIKDRHYLACTSCGNMIKNRSLSACPNCGHDHWVRPSIEFVENE